MFRRMIMLALVLMVSACSFLEVKPEKLALEPSVKIFKFLSTLPDGNTITEESIRYKILAEIKKSTKLKELTAYARSCANCPQDYKGFEARVSRTNNNEIVLSYVNGEMYQATGIHKTVISGVFTIDITDTKGFKIVRVISPKSLELIPGRDGLFIPYKPLASIQSVASDVKRISTMLNPSFSLNKQYSGSFNVKFNDESVYANFRRILGSWEVDSNNKSDIKKSQRFKLDGSYVEVSVYPYRNGSKVEYSYPLSYSISGQGQSTFTAMDERSKVLAKRIKEVARD